MKHTIAELLAMPASELDRIAAEVVCGWILDKFDVAYRTPGNSKIESWRSDFHPSTDYNDAAILRAKIAERGLASIHAVCDQLNKMIPEDTPNDFWTILTITPREQTIACILVAQETKQ